MKKIAIDEAPAGPAMDAAVAEVLGGLRPAFGMVAAGWPAGPWREYNGCWYPRPFSTDIVAAWGLVEKGRLHIGPIVRDDKVITGWYCAGHQDLSKAIVLVGGSSAPLAICRAFLKANGVEYVEVERTAENNAQVCGLNSVGRKASADHPWRGKRAKA